MNKETVEQMLIRKFKMKYIDLNPAFSSDIGMMNQSSPKGIFNGAGRFDAL